MVSLLRIFLSGMLISFLGALPLGTLNVAAMQVAIEENTNRAVKFALGVAIVEIAYVRLSLSGIQWIIQHERLFDILQWLTVVLFLVLGVSSFLAARKHKENSKSILLKNNVNRFWLGFTMSAVNPVQIPFWFIWSTYLVSTHVLYPSEKAYLFYIIGIGIGTLGGLAVFIFAGKWLMQKINASQRWLNVFIGCVFIVSALIQAWRMFHGSFNARLH
jgi:threonine/homoserine/homoserine lactone efflux protein